MATAGRAVFFSGLTVLLGLTGLVLFEFMILRSVGIAGAIVVGLAVPAALTLLPAVLASWASGSTRVGSDRSMPGGRGRAVGPARPTGHAPSLAVFVPTLGFLLLLGAPFLHVRFNAPDATILPPEVPSRAAYDLLAAKFGEGEFAPLVAGHPDDGAATVTRRTWPPSTTTRGGSRPTRGSSAWTAIVDVDPRLTRDAVPAPLRRTGRSARSVRGDGPGGHHAGRPDHVHADHARTGRTRPRRAPWSTTCATRARPLAPPPG